VRLLLDTHILLWATLKPDLIPALLRAQLLDPQHQLLLSAATAWELSIKHQLGRLSEAAPLLVDFAGIAERLGAGLLNITPAHGIRAGALDWGHRDPFDRMLVAQALEEGLRLVTLDEGIRAYVRAPVFF